MKTKFSLIAIVIILAIIMISCDLDHTGNSIKEFKKQKELSNEGLRQTGFPAIVNFQEKKLAKSIYELRDQENLICYAYIKSEYTGKLVFIGKCIGYGLPYSTQYSCPERYIGNGATLPQAEPNGLYMPQSTAATWLMMIDEKGTARAVYIEPEIIVSPFPLTKGIECSN